jgi:outer membrane assembly lipoprotein YfiO
MRVGRSYFKQAHAIPQRDQTYTQLAVKALDGFEDRFPDSDYLADVTEMRDKCRGRLARAEAQIGDYYFWRSSFDSAERRYQYLVTNYSETDVAVRGRYRLGVCAFQLDRPDEAVLLLQQFNETYPEAPQVKRATRWLDRIAAGQARPAKARHITPSPPADDAGPVPQ